MIDAVGRGLKLDVRQLFQRNGRPNDGIDVNFIKIDVEGFEMQVLSGLEQTIRRCRPALFVEVQNTNMVEFNKYLASVGYRVEKLMRNGSFDNVIAVHA